MNYNGSWVYNLLREPQFSRILKATEKHPRVERRMLKRIKPTKTKLFINVTYRSHSLIRWYKELLREEIDDIIFNKQRLWIKDSIRERYNWHSRLRARVIACKNKDFYKFKYFSYIYS